MQVSRNPIYGAQRNMAKRIQSSPHVPGIDPRPGRSAVVRIKSAGRQALDYAGFGMGLFAYAVMILFRCASEAFTLYTAVRQVLLTLFVD